MPVFMLFLLLIESDSCLTQSLNLKTNNLLIPFISSFVQHVLSDSIKTFSSLFLYYFFFKIPKNSSSKPIAYSTALILLIFPTFLLFCLVFFPGFVNLPFLVKNPFFLRHFSFSLFLFLFISSLFSLFSFSFSFLFFRFFSFHFFFSLGQPSHLAVPSKDFWWLLRRFSVPDLDGIQRYFVRRFGE